MFRIHPARLHQSVTVHVARTLTACVLLLASVAALCSPSVVAAQDSSSSTYIVVPGDTLGAIATRLGVSLEALIAANGIQDPSLIRVGQELIIPNADGTVPVVAVAAATETGTARALAGETIATLAARFAQDAALVAELNDAPPERRLFPGQPVQIPRQAVPPPSANFGAITAVDAPASIVQGRTGRIYVETSRPLLLRGGWNGRSLVFTAIGDDGLRQFAFVPVDALLEPGQYPLHLGYVTARGDFVQRAWLVQVAGGLYDYQEIVVPEDKAAALTSDVVVAERERVVETWSQLTPSVFWERPFQRPIDTDYPTTSPFGTRRTYSVADIGNFHAGQDFGAPEGTLVVVPAPGIVALAEPLAVRGNAVIIDHGRGVFSGYWHLSERKVEVGMWVDTGDVLGLVGNTGMSTGAHLHWELRINGVAVDPMQFIDEAPFAGPEIETSTAP